MIDDPGLIPEEFRDLGFSGAFTTEAVMDVTPEVLAGWEARVPCFLPGDRWIAVRVNRERRTMTVVRRDDAAICDLVFAPRLP